MEGEKDGAKRPHGAAGTGVVLGVRRRRRGCEEERAEQEERGTGPHGSGR